MRSVMVTGGAGFIGSAFVRLLLTREPDVAVVTYDALTYAGSLDNLAGLPPGRHGFVHGDVCDGARVLDVMRRHQVDTVVHFAAESHVDRAIEAPADFLRTNVLGTSTVLQAAARHSAEVAPVRFHHVGTDEVYGELAPDAPPCTEAHPYAPGNPYAASKAAADHLTRAWHRTHGLWTTVSIGSNTYGPRQFPEKLIPLVVSNALRAEPLPVYGDGLQVRDWLHADDHCRAILAILRGSGPGETWHVGGGNQVENIDLVHRLCAVLDVERPSGAPTARLVRHVGDRPGHDRRYAVDTTRIRQALGWRPEMDFNQGLRDTVRWYLDNEAWTAAMRSRPEYRQWQRAR